MVAFLFVQRNDAQGTLCILLDVCFSSTTRLVFSFLTLKAVRAKRRRLVDAVLAARGEPADSGSRRSRIIESCCFVSLLGRSLPLLSGMIFYSQK